MVQRRRRRRRQQVGGALVKALSTLAPIGKGAALGLAKALGKRAVKKAFVRHAVLLWELRVPELATVSGKS